MNHWKVGKLKNVISSVTSVSNVRPSMISLSFCLLVRSDSIQQQGYKEITLMISPDGKRFDTLEKAKDYMEEQRNKKQSSMNEMLRRLFEAEDTPLAMSESARYRRKYMARKNPFRNLRQRTLENNHVQHASQEENTIKYQKYLATKKRALRKSKKMSAQESINNTQNVNIIIEDMDRETHFRVKRTTLMKKTQKVLFRNSWCAYDICQVYLQGSENP